ncbi:MAG: type IV pilin N-terminal domain-containing protein, partial [Halanaeroarchaeum sp.]
MTEDRGASESVGAILLVSITVISISVVGGAMFAANSPTPHPNAKIDATADGSTLTIEHRAGEPLAADSFEVILQPSGITFAGTNGEPVAEGSDAQFEPGERWNFSADSRIGADETVALVYTEGDRILLDETALPGPGIGPATTTQDE